MSDQELEQKWRAEFEAFVLTLAPTIIFERSVTSPNVYKNKQLREGYSCYLAACRARHAEAEALRAESARLRESH